MAWSRRVLSHPMPTLAVKAAIATGAAFSLGSILPAPLNDYRYYAALGAFMVIGLVVTDSVKEALRVLAAIAIGVGVAMVLQAVYWTNAVTVAAAVLVSVLLGALPALGQQRSWAPIAALFVLATGGPEPQPVALGYLVQVPLGAAVGIVVNLAIFAPLPTYDLERSAARLRMVLASQMRRYADLLQVQASHADGSGADTAGAVHGLIDELQQAQGQLRTDIAESFRAQRGNPRVWFGHRSSTELVALADALSRCGTAVEAVGVMLRESTPPQQEAGVALRAGAVEVLTSTAEVFDDPARAAEGSAPLAAAHRSLEQLLARVEAMPPGEEVDRYLLGALALTTRHALDAFVREVASRAPAPGSGSTPGAGLPVGDR